MKWHHSFIARWDALLARPIGGRRRYRTLHTFLVSRGWELDTECGDPCWNYSPAYGGAAVALNPAELDVPDLADLGPHRPTIYLSDHDTTVYSHGTFNGCQRHREQRWTLAHTKPDNPRELHTLIAEIEHAARPANARSYQHCVIAGPCGTWLRRWHAEGGPWPPGQTT